MTLVSPSQSSVGEEINASDINGPINQLAAVVNGSLDDTNISALSGTKITAGTLPASAMNTATNVETRADEGAFDFVASGCVWSISSGLNGTMTAGVVYVDGKRLTVSAIASRAFTVSKDTYVSVDSNGTIAYTEVANNASSPTLPAGTVWLAKVITTASAISFVYTSATDSNGNLLRPLKVGTKQTDTSGWRIYDYGDHRVYRIRQSFSVTKVAGEYFVVSAPALPVGFATIGSNYISATLAAGTIDDAWHGVKLSATTATALSYSMHANANATYAGWVDWELRTP